MFVTLPWPTTEINKNTTILKYLKIWENSLEISEQSLLNDILLRL